jgi:prolyl oligopeptidase
MNSHQRQDISMADSTRHVQPMRSMTALSRIALGMAIAWLTMTIQAAAIAPPPPAPSEPVTDVLNGVSVPDPYRNLENLKDPKTLAWLKAEGDYAADQLSRIEGRDAIAKRIEELDKAAGDKVQEVTRMPGDRIFYLSRKVGENQFKLMMRVGVNGAERVLVDPDQIDKTSGVPHAINYFSPSWDGKRMAYGVSAGGSEDASLYVLDIASGQAIGAPIPRVSESVHWTPDSNALTYNQLRELPPGTSDTETYLDTTVFLMKIASAKSSPQGRSTTQIRPLFGPLINKDLKLDRLDVAEVFFSPGGRYMIARTTDTTAPEGCVFVAPLKDLSSRHIGWRQISTFTDKITDVQMRGDTLYMRTYADAPRGRVIALSLKNPALAKATLAIHEPDEGVLKSFALGRDAIYTEIQKGFTTRAHRLATGSSGQGVDLTPTLAGSTFVTGDPGHAYADAWIVTSAWTEPARILITTPTTVAEPTPAELRDTGLLQNQRPPGTPELEVSEVMVASHDGAQVPLAILHRKGLPLNGDNPTLLDGYGAYGITTEAFYDPRRIAWIERGGVLAYANVRGSGAFGDAWYRAGFKSTKSNTWKDGIACAHYLIDHHYASSSTLGIHGASAGGIFVGRSTTAAPELFAAAIFEVGTLDTVRAEESANGATNISEFGSYKNAADLPALIEMSTYHQTKDGTAYPAVMLIHGMNDPRVDVWQSAKAAARLQAASSSGKPILLRLDSQAGHGMGSTAQQRFSKQADIYAFLLWQFGLSKQDP